ncbi:transmembrane protein 154 isoform X1 [Brachionichthys hirsutus]|uniref:transmembrane protein 154 isoform X1 n=1 Tax=Brachionichthys hirsutus TaxID=412623 RepID=UPI0036049736
MSGCRPGRMRTPRMTTPFFLLLLLNSLTGTVLCDDEEDGAGVEAGIEEDEIADPDPAGGDDAEATEQPSVDPDITSSTETPIENTSTSVDENIEENHGSGLGDPIIDGEATGNPELMDSTSIPDDEEEEGLSFIIILIPVVLVVLIIGMIVCGIFINRRWNQQVRDQELRKQDPYLDGSSTEKVPMPMFEEDVPSVLELEMEELDQWMKKDGETAEESIPV